MKNKTLMNFALSTLVATSSFLPIFNLRVLAEVTPSQKQMVAINPNNILFSHPEKSLTSIPSNTALVVKVEKAIMFDAGGRNTQDITLRTSEPILDDNGNVIIPEGSLVQGRLKPSRQERGAYIEAVSLHIGGQVVEVEAETELIPGVILPVKTRLQAGQEFAQFGYIPGLGVGLATGNEVMGTLATAGLGFVIGFLSPKDMLAVNIPQNSTYILEIEESVALSQELVQAQKEYLAAKSRSKNQQQNAVTAEQVAQYSQEAWIAYQKGQISEAEYKSYMLQVVEAIN